jgi:hypothetical protein
MIRQPSFPFGAEPVVVRPGLPEQLPEPVPRFTVPLPLNTAPVSPTFCRVERSTMPLVPAAASPWVLVPPADPLVPSAAREVRATVVDRPEAARVQRDAQLPPRPPARLRWTPTLGGLVFIAGVFIMQLGVIAIAVHVQRSPAAQAAPAVSIASRAGEPAGTSAPEMGTARACFDVVTECDDAPAPSDCPPVESKRPALRTRPAPSPRGDVRDPLGP